MARMETGERARRIAGAAGRAGDALLWLLAVLMAYVAAALVGGSVPVDAGWRPPAGGVTVYVESNGFHTDLVLPVVAAGVDWRGLIRPGDFADPRYAAYDHVAIGWGERDFYLGTPRWQDARPWPLLHAALGSDATLMHVEYLPPPVAAPDVRPIVLSPAAYRRLAAFVRSSFADGPGGTRPAHRFGYGTYDAFYRARGHYDAFRTCNAWTGRALRTAGVRVGAWTPLAVTVMAWFEPPPR